MEQTLDDCLLVILIIVIIVVIFIIIISVVFLLFNFFLAILDKIYKKSDSVDSSEDRKYSSENVERPQDKKYSTARSERPQNYDKDVESIRNRLVKEYYQMNDDIRILSKINMKPEDVLQFFENKSIFPFQSEFKCVVTPTDNYFKIGVKILYSQGSRIFFAARDNSLYEKLNGQDELVFDKINKIYSSITKDCKCDLDRERRIHDYLIATSRYDHENLANDTIPPVSYTPYGILFNHVAVCKAYAETFMIFMQLANIECHFVIGKTKNSHYSNKDSLHAWNIVRIDGKYMHVDVTFDNPVPYTIGRVDHTYFNVSDETMRRTHEWNTSHYPECR